MDTFLTFVSLIASTFFIANILYIIFQCKTTLPYIFLGIYHLVAIFDVITLAINNAGAIQILIYALIRILPVTIGALLFIYYTNGSLRISFKKSNKKVLKSNLKYDIVSIKFERIIVLSGMIFSLIFSVLIFFFIKNVSTKYLLIGVLMAGFILAIVLYFKNKHIQTEKVIVFVGKEKELIYSYEIPKNLYRIPLTSFYDRKDYIIDPIGIAYINNEKHYLYWIGTSQKVDISNEKLVKIESTPYNNHLDIFEKFYYQLVWFSNDGEAITKKKRIK